MSCEFAIVRGKWRGRGIGPAIDTGFQFLLKSTSRAITWRPAPSSPMLALFRTLTFVLFCLAGGVGFAAAPGTTGTITGRVQNVVTGQYLNQARVTLRGSSQVVFTDNFGTYQLVGVPVGTATVEFFYTDLDPVVATLTVTAGGTLEHNVDLTSAQRYGRDAATVKLDAFVVASDKETDAQAIATNEQRFAPNLKNVLSTDALGDVVGGSVGEFLKFIPGLTADFDNADIAGVSVRGIGGGMTSITSDGAPATNIWAGTSRTVDLRSMALNDISRIELSKVPTPANPADSLAGAVNLVGKSAFERSGRQLRWGVNVVANHEDLEFRRTPSSYRDRLDGKIIPGANFDFTWPITRNFGVVIAGSATEIFNEQHFARTTWATTGTGGALATASQTNPYLQSFLLVDGPRYIARNSLSAKADWRIMRHGVLSLGHTINRSTTRIGALQMTFNAGNNGTPTPAGSANATWDPTFSRGSLGRATITNNGTAQLANQKSDNTNLTFRYDDGRWRLETGLSRSESHFKRRYHDGGFFYQAIATNSRPIRINFLDIAGDKPGRIEAFDATNQPFDFRDLSNYRPTTTNVADTNTINLAGNGYLNLQRQFDLLPFPTAIQIGGSERVQRYDTNPQTINLTFNGPAAANAEPYGMQVYRNMDSHYGFYGIEWMSPTRTFAAYRANPALYTKTEAQMVAEGNARIDGSEFIRETIRAAYIQGDATFFRNRLRLLGGVRFEETHDKAQGGLNNADAVWQRNPDGSYVRNAAGLRIRRPDAGAANSYAQFLLTRKMRASFSDRTYSGYYPSAHLTFNVTEHFVTRAAWAQTYGRPNFADIIPRTVATGADLDDDDPDPITGRGTLTIRNPTLKPWTADNFDLSAEYYTPQGGLLSAGVFRKDIQNFFGDSARIANAALVAELGIDPRYVGWNVLTKFNAGDARITGAEFNARHSLRLLGRLGAPFTVFANATFLDLDGGPGAAFTSFVPKSGNWGATFANKRVTVTARWNYRGLDRRAPQAAFGPDGYDYYKARITLDMNATWQLTRRIALSAAVNNLLNEPQTSLRYGSNTPAYARQFEEREFGIQLSAGIRGTF